MDRLEIKVFAGCGTFLLFLFALFAPRVALVILVLTFLVAAVWRWHWVSRLMTKPRPFNNEDSWEWTRYRRKH